MATDPANDKGLLSPKFDQARLDYDKLRQRKKEKKNHVVKKTEKTVKVKVKVMSKMIPSNFT